MNQVSCDVKYFSYMCGNQLLLEVLTFVLICPMFLINKIHYFAYTSTLGVLILIFNLIVICYSAIDEIEGTENEMEFVEFLP